MLLEDTRVKPQAIYRCLIAVSKLQTLFFIFYNSFKDKIKPDWLGFLIFIIQGSYQKFRAQVHYRFIVIFLNSITLCKTFGVTFLFNSIDYYKSVELIIINNIFHKANMQCS